MWQSVEALNVFNTLTTKQIFWKTKTFFKKLDYRFLVASAKIEANVKQIEWWVQNGTYHKDGSFASNYFIFLKILFQFQNLLQILDLMYQLPICSYSYFP